MIEVAHKLVLSNQHVKGWIPNSKVVDGIEFVELNQWDRKFHLFCTGKFLTFPKGQSHKAHTRFMDYLVQQRTTSSREVFEASRRMLQGAAEDKAPPNSKKRVRACRMSDAAMSGDIVSCDLEYRGARANIKMLFGIQNQKLWVEASPANLQFVADGINHDWVQGIVSPLGHHRIRGDADATVEDADATLEDEHATTEDADADADVDSE